MPRPAAHRPPDRIVAHTIGLDAEVTVIGWHLVERNGQMISEWDVADHAVTQGFQAITTSEEKCFAICMTWSRVT
jgi:hypothetical protein